jgi:arylsulfatase A-like enzyme
MPTPSIDKMAADGLTFFSFYAQPSCTPGRAAMQTGRIPNRSGMTTVAFQGQGGGLPAAEWTLASVLKQGGYQTYFTGKWHLGEADYALPNAQGYDEMKYVGLYHLNAYTYGDPTWFPDMDPELRAFFNQVTKGSMSGKAGQKPKEDFKINGQYVNEPGKPVTLHGVSYPDGVVGIPFFDGYVEKAALEFLDQAAKTPGKPFFINVNFMKVHQPNLPAPEFKLKSLSKTNYADSVVELDTRIGRIMDKLRALGLDKDTLVVYTTDNGAWQDVYPDAGYTPFRGTKGTVREGGNRVPAIAIWPGKIKAGSKNHEIVGGLDLMATFASLGGVKLPEKDRAGQPIIFDSHDMSPVLFGTGKSDAQVVVLLHRERVVARCGALRQVQGGVQPAWRQRRGDGWLGRRHQPGLERPGKIRRHRTADLRPVAGPAGALRHLHEQLHRAHLDHGAHRPGAVRADEDLRQVPAAQAAEHGLRRANRNLQVPEVPVRPRDAGERRHRHPAADG